MASCPTTSRVSWYRAQGLITVIHAGSIHCRRIGIGVQRTDPLPASADSIPTVQHHEDHVSMSPIAARKALEILECLADIIAIELLVGAQALDLRHQVDQYDAPADLSGSAISSAKMCLSGKMMKYFTQRFDRFQHWYGKGSHCPTKGYPNQSQVTQFSRIHYILTSSNEYGRNSGCVSIPTSITLRL